MAVLGPTNTGKTHYALERMCGYATGMIGLPLRLLAREIYERLVGIKGVNAVALITGEEKIIPRLPAYFVCTVEAMPLERTVDFLAVDEIQLCGDAERGHVFTDRLLHARGRFETLFLGASTFAPLFRRLFPEGEVMLRERLSQLSYSGPKKLTRLPKRSAIVAFSTEKVYAIAELIRRQRGGAAVVMGSLSPKTRNAQVELFQKAEVDFLVATDAIGMGLNMDIAHVAFSGLSKFDGKHTRHLTAQEIGQIAGRAGRFTREGTFGVTGECHELDADLVHAVENHEFSPLDAAEWRNPFLDFSSLEALLRSLTRPSDTPGLRLAKEALDEKALRLLAKDDDIATKITNPVSLRILWEACQLPDFRKTGLDEYLKLVTFLFWSRLSPDGYVPEDWFETQIHDLDRTDGDIDTLSARLSGVRTLSYIANRGGWLKRVEHWRDATRDLEERLSDRLHEALMQRFIDTRTSALLKALNADEALRPEVNAAGQVIIEGHEVGELKGLSFQLSSSESVIADKTLRQAAFRAVNPLLLDRLRDLGNTSSKALRVQDGYVLWNNERVAKIEPSDYFAPRLKLFESADHPALRARAEKRLTDYVRQTSLSLLKSLAKIKTISENQETTANIRAIAFQLFENNGVLRRDETLKLTPEEKAALKAAGVAGHRYLWFLPDLQHGKQRHYMRGFGGSAGNDQCALSLQGLVKLGDQPVSLKTLSQLDKIMGAGLYQKGGLYVRSADMDALGLDEKARDKLMLALGYVKMPSITVPVAQPTANPAQEPEVAVETPAPEETALTDVVADAVPEAAASPPALPETLVQPPASAETPAPATELPEPPAAPEMEERLGWRQKRPDSEKPPRLRHKPKHAASADNAADAKSHGKSGQRHKSKTPGPKPKPDKPREPYINPYSPFAILRERLKQPN
ncbi:MAG TPA: helicase-related protein [Asticcacaulis sp.]|nr:helicase-related protein [Asticcacaulis sp.]